mmetsp:Transcript_25065/g.70676  ORF Transcript_25065/g.70676 Transcript_25065/m.70676 type:complete len:227 (-) Transcript_25065:554-1234(-)
MADQPGAVAPPVPPRAGSDTLWMPRSTAIVMKHSTGMHTSFPARTAMPHETCDLDSSCSSLPPAESASGSLFSKMLCGRFKCSCSTSLKRLNAPPRVPLRIVRPISGTGAPILLNASPTNCSGEAVPKRRACKGGVSPMTIPSAIAVSTGLRPPRMESVQLRSLAVKLRRTASLLVRHTYPRILPKSECIWEAGLPHLASTSDEMVSDGTTSFLWCCLFPSAKTAE